MRALLVLSLSALALAGCIAAPSPLESQGDALPPAADNAVAMVPDVASWTGRVLVTPLGALAHNRDTETMVADIQREGFVFEITEVPQDFTVTLTWTGQAAGMLVMVSTPHVDGKGQEYFTDMSPEGPLCLRVPATGIMLGKWQVMAHSSDAADVDFTFDVATLGGKAAILEGEPHSSAEAAETTEADHLPCDDAAPAA